MPYIELKRQELGLNTDQVLNKHNIISLYVAAKITNHFHSLDLTVNGMAKTFFKKKIGIDTRISLRNNSMVELKSIQLK